MKRENRRRKRQRPPRVAAAIDPVADPSPAPPRPEFLHMDDRNSIWRASWPAALGLPWRPITWDIRLRENDIAVCADLDRQGEMRDIDFREVRGRLNDVLVPKSFAEGSIAFHTKRICRSLYWQRTPDDDSCHLLPAEFDEATYWWSFSTSISRQTPDWKFPLDGPVVRPASNQMLLERHEERQWAAYARQRLKWAGKLSLDPDVSENLRGSGQICRLRLLHYWQIPECRQLFISSKSIATLFCTPGLIPELDDTIDPSWQETVTRLARLPRREWMERIGLPPSRQAARLFLRIKPCEIVPHLPLMRQAFANPLALKRLSDTTCGIDEMMLRLCQYETFPLYWPLFRQLCRHREKCDPSLGYINQIIQFFRDDDAISLRMRQRFRWARSVEDLRKVHRSAAWLRMHWHGLFQPGIQDSLGNLIAPLPETETIRLLNRPQDLLNISAANDLCLEQYLHPITQGQYALYQVRHQGEFAVAGLRRTDNGPWEIDQIRSKKNADPSQALIDSVMAWHAEPKSKNLSKIAPSNSPQSTPP
jgi:hypothetical protein